MPNRDRDEANAATIATLLGLAVIASGGLAMALGGDGSPAQPPSVTTEGDETDEQAVSLDWQGRLANSVCVPSGPYVCHGTEIGEADDRLDTQIGADVAHASLELAWEAATPDTEQLTFSLVSGHTTCEGDCFHWTVLAQTTGSSPLTLDAQDLTTVEGDTLWVLVDAPDRTPSPLHSDVHTEQPFEVSGEIVTTGGST